MALVKSWPDKTDVNPISAAYIRHVGLYIEPVNRTIRAVFNVYRDQESRDAGKNLVDQITFTLSGDDYDAFVGDQTQAADSIGNLVYNYAKSQAVLAGAADA